MNALSRLCVILYAVGILFPGPASADENNLIIRQPSPPVQEIPDSRTLPDRPEVTISRPDGTSPNVHIIERTSPDVNVITPSTPDINVVRPGGTVTQTPAAPDVNVTAKPAPDVNVVSPATPDINVVRPEGTVTQTTAAPNVNITARPAPDVNVVTPATPDINVVRPGGTVTQTTAAPNVNITEPQKSPGTVQLWELLPLNPVKKEKAETAKAKTTPAVPDKRSVAEKKPEPRKTAQKVQKPVKTAAVKQETPPRPPKPEPAKAEKKPEKTIAPKPEPVRKARPGEQLRIPPEAVQTGRLDFLEGCWQGTRPEYFSKRIVRECFCFGPQGSYGRRTVIDPTGRRGGRTCTGTTRARMEGSTLRVSSSGAFCSDGERWGAAQMTCRGSGQSTPCSWIFTDANGGRQSYEIPFVRVESCGGRR